MKILGSKKFKSYTASKIKEVLEKVRNDAIKNVKARHDIFLNPSAQIDFQADLASELNSQISLLLKELEKYN